MAALLPVHDCETLSTRPTRATLGLVAMSAIHIRARATTSGYSVVLRF